MTDQEEDDDGMAPITPLTHSDMVDLFRETIEQNLEKLGTITLELRGVVASMSYNFKKNTTIEQLFNFNSQALPWLIKTVLDQIMNYKSYINVEDEDVQNGLRFYIIHYFTIILFGLFHDDQNYKPRKSSIIKPKDELLANSRKSLFSTLKPAPATRARSLPRGLVSVYDVDSYNNGGSRLHIRTRDNYKVMSTIHCPCKEDLRPFYILMKQFGYYNLCYPRQDRSEESFYLQMFAKCKLTPLN